MRRLRVQVTVLLALLGLLVVAWSNTSLQSTVERVDDLRRAATRLSRDFVTMETSRRAYLLTGDRAAELAQVRAEVSAVQGFERVRQLSGRWQALRPVVEGVADEYRAWWSGSSPRSGRWPPGTPCGPSSRPTCR
jgi:uncharacterized protein YbjT (DUF2867 family)